MEFSLKAYADYWGVLQDAGYSLAHFHTLDQAQAPFVIYRHDIDMNPWDALRMAEVEAQMGVQASYFFLFTALQYNLMAPEVANIVRQIGEMGHPVGLHFDAAAYPGETGDQMKARLEAECALLAEVVREPLEIVSFHRPTANAEIDMNLVAGDRVHTYLPQFTGEIGYCSDSAGEWKHGDPYERGFHERGENFQFLTHPLWWCSERDDSPTAKLHRHIDFVAAKLDHDLHQTIRTYQGGYGK